MSSTPANQARRRPGVAGRIGTRWTAATARRVLSDAHRAMTRGHNPDVAGVCESATMKAPKPSPAPTPSSTVTAGAAGRRILSAGRRETRATATTATPTPTAVSGPSRSPMVTPTSTGNRAAAAAATGAASNIAPEASAR